MGCNCKNNVSDIKNLNVETKSKNRVINSILNFITFIIVFTIAVPVIIPLVAYMLFKSIVLRNSQINMSSLFLKFGKKLMADDANEDEKDEDDSEYELFENNNYILTDYDEVNTLETK
jgi:hypothetical protein